MITKSLKELIESREFISLASCDLEFRPNAAPKFLLKVEGDYLYLVDYIIGRTFTNLKVNPRASLSFIDSNTLIGYQINGKVEVIDSGSEYNLIIRQLHDKQIDLSIARVIEGVTKGRAHKSFEVAIPEQFVIFKVKMEEVVEMRPSGTLKRERVR
ncbi:MAG: pyridoxamine 5'-phosphate oxidase family protein [Candidatus Omnitrophica bacterium]|nr:pyridoxamine 5'-phosphate oxidase family protein [Candidatus Omnitrophota bacterium]MDD5042874.1 pyridoxamine 5'-phosphate oxidase family protein [Candidatus Omnitrophota bacterium]MDD5500764.1 pyridoxamine 5'-phosphate oxidase family protein [Candidatus Omnitrophota bacterium]